MRALCSRCQQGVAVLEHGQLFTLDLHDDLPVDNKQLTSTRAPLLPLAPASDQSLSLSTFAMVHIGSDGDVGGMVAQLVHYYNGDDGDMVFMITMIVNISAEDDNDENDQQKFVIEKGPCWK